MINSAKIYSNFILLDTIKTRIQSKNGFLKSGGFSKIYSGVGFALLGSIPTGKLRIFFTFNIFNLSHLNLQHLFYFLPMRQQNII